MKKKSILFMFCTVILSSIVNADGWQEVGKITRIHTGHGTASFNNNAIYFTTETQIDNPSCASNAGYAFLENNSNADRIYSLLLSAYISKNSISIYVTDRCLAGRPEVDAVQLKDIGVPF